LVNKKTVFVLGAGASCPYGYPSGAQLRTEICLGFKNDYLKYFKDNGLGHTIEGKNRWDQINRFIYAFNNSSTPSIDLFMARNHKWADIGKYIIAYQILTAEQRSSFRELVLVQREWYERQTNLTSTPDFVRKGYFKGDDWYSYLFHRLTAGLIKPDELPDFSKDKISFITFNYDRSLEYFLYDSFDCSFSEFSEKKEFNVAQYLKKLKILHVYGQIAPLKWQSSEGVDYAPVINEDLLQKASKNIRTIYEEKQNPELTEAQKILKDADQIFFLGFGYAPENMEVLGLPGAISPVKCWVFGTAFGLNETEINHIRKQIIKGVQFDRLDFSKEKRIVIKPMDCVELLRNHLH
jgi:hypothetical protein